MVDPVARSALEGLRLPDVPGIVSVRDAGDLARVMLRGPREAAAALMGDLGLALPARINRATEAGKLGVLQLGPDEWLLIGPASSAPRITAAAATAPALSHIDISHRTCGLVLDGRLVEDVLASGCPLPLGLAAFPVGRATRTLFAKAEVVLWRQAETLFHLEVGRSFADYVVASIAEAALDEGALAKLQRG
jgi:sarcosine oxidase subunit gamma